MRSRRKSHLVGNVNSSKLYTLNINNMVPVLWVSGAYVNLNKQYDYRRKRRRYYSESKIQVSLDWFPFDIQHSPSCTSSSTPTRDSSAAAGL